MTATTLVIYHRNDFDGLCSGAIAKRSLGSSADYLGWDYNDPLPDLSPYQTVYLIDISLPPEVMAANAAKLIWIDHHASAIKANAAVTIPGLRIDGVAACRLAWQWFNGDKTAVKADYVDSRVSEPYAVKLLGFYDIWDKRDPNTDPFQVGLQAHSSPNWDLIFDQGSAGPAYVGTVVKEGQIIQRYLTVTNKQIANERGFDLDWEGLHFRALNNARSNSITFKDALTPEHDGCLSYQWNGKLWSFSLYGVPGKPDVDLSKIAVKHGGGGHKQAAGGTFKVLPPELGGAAI